MVCAHILGQIETKHIYFMSEQIATVFNGHDTPFAMYRAHSMTSIWRYKLPDAVAERFSNLIDFLTASYPPVDRLVPGKMLFFSLCQNKLIDKTNESHLASVFT